MASPLTPPGRPRLSDPGAYAPLAILAYGSYADGSWGPDSDFDALVLTAGGPERHDMSVVGSVQLDAFVYPVSRFDEPFAPSAFPQLADATLLLDTEGRGSDPHRPGAGLAGDAAPPHPGGATLPGDLVPQDAPEGRPWRTQRACSAALGASGQPWRSSACWRGSPTGAQEEPTLAGLKPAGGLRPLFRRPGPAGAARSGAVDRPPGGPVRLPPPDLNKRPPGFCPGGRFSLSKKSVRQAFEPSSRLKKLSDPTRGNPSGSLSHAPSLRTVSQEGLLTA